MIKKMVTNETIEYKSVPQGIVGVIPKGTEVILASNLPITEESPQYWVKDWVGMTENEKSWSRNYGYLVDSQDIEEYKRYTGNIVQDTDYDVESPRNWDNLGTFVCWHRRYNIGDVNYTNRRAGDWLAELLTELYPENDSESWWILIDELENNCELSKGFELANKRAVILPVQGYDHGQLSITANPIESMRYPYNDIWDSGQLGYIFATRETIQKEYNVKYLTKGIRAKVSKILQQEIETMNQYLVGDIWGFEIFDTITEMVIDSCWGFFGTDHCESEMQQMLDYFESEHQKEQISLDSRMLHGVAV